MSQFSMKLMHAAKAINAELIGDGDITFERISIDTRTLEEGDLYFAISGENFDGHDFLDAAKARGACGFVVDEAKDGFSPEIKVKNTRQALGDLAEVWRDQSTAKVIALTGSNGKTTVKGLIGRILESYAKTLITKGNLNNEIGVPLMLFQLTPEHEFAVLELGANHLAEIDRLTRWVKPKVALITNAGSAHLEGFGSRENIALGKAEIFNGLDDDGIAIINADSEYTALWQTIVEGKRQLTFGWSDIANVKGRFQGESFSIQFPDEEMPIQLKLIGKHNYTNALAAAAVAYALDIPSQTIKAGLESFTGEPGRLQRHDFGSGACVIDDSYNANPTSVCAAIDALSSLHTSNRVLVLGDMAELGAEAAHHHFVCGQYAKSKGIDYVYAVGAFAKQVLKGFGSDAGYCETTDEAISRICSQHGSYSAILVKGSRSAKMERVVKGVVDCFGNTKLDVE